MRGHNPHEGYEPNPALTCAMASANWAESVSQALDGEESEVPAIDPLLMGDVSDDPLEPDYGRAVSVAENQPLSSPTPGRVSGGDNSAEHVTTQDVPTQAAHAVPHYEVDEEELIPDYRQILAEEPTLHRAEIPITAMEVERTAEGNVQTGAEARDPASLSSGVAVSDAVQRSLLSHAITEQVSNVVQSQMAPLFHQLFNRLELMENRQVRLDEQVQETNRALLAEAQNRVNEGNRTGRSETETQHLAGSFAHAMRIREVPSQEVSGLMSASAAGRDQRPAPREHSSITRGKRILESLRDQSQDVVPPINTSPSEHVERAPNTGQRQEGGQEQSGLVTIGGVPHAWRLTPTEGLKLEPLDLRPQSSSHKAPSSQSVFTSRAPSPFEPVKDPPKSPKAIRSRSGSPIKQRAASEGRVSAIKGC